MPRFPKPPGLYLGSILRTVLLANLLAVLLASGGCQEGRVEGSGFSVMDSAGVQVVESDAPAWAPGMEWAVASEPDLQLGVLDGQAEYVFDRIGNAFLLSDGRIALANRRTSEVRFFAGDGTFLSSSGRSGEGPGEFLSMSTWRGLSDSLFVFDARLARVSVLDSEGEFVRSIQLLGEPDLGHPSAFGSTSMGGLYVTSGIGGFAAGDRGLLEGSEIIFSVHGGTGGFERELGRFRAAPQWAHTAAGRTTALYLPHSVGWTVHAWRPETLYVGVGTEPEIEVRESDGSLVQLIRWGAETRLVGEEEIAEYREEFLGYYEDPNLKRLYEGWLEAVPFPDRLPFFDGLLLDRTDHLWVELYKPFWDESRSWSVFSPEGRWLGTLDTPRDLRITEIGEDYVLGVWRDELGVEYLRKHGLDRRGM